MAWKASGLSSSEQLTIVSSDFFQRGYFPKTSLFIYFLFTLGKPFSGSVFFKGAQQTQAIAILCTCSSFILT